MKEDKWAALNRDFSFHVGVVEKHQVSVHWNQKWGVAHISVEGEEVVRNRHIFGFRTVRRIESTVGDPEAHSVLIEKRRAAFYGALQRQTFSAYIDGNLVGEY